MARDFTAYVETFFPPRNGVKPIVREGRNFTRESLAYMAPASRADKVTQRLISLYGSNPFMVVDATAGLGGQTISFLERKEIGLVLAYEGNEERRVMLERNITAYKLGSKVLVQGAAFGNPKEPDGPNLAPLAGCALYFDSQWLSEDIRGNETTSCPQVGSKTIEQWLERYRGIAYAFAAHLPPKCVLVEIKGWDLQKEELVNANGEVRAALYYGICKDAAPYVGLNEGGLKPYQPLLKAPKPPLLVDWNDPNPLVETQPPANPSAAVGPALPFPDAIIPIVREDLPPVPPPSERPVTSGDRVYKPDEPVHAPPQGYVPPDRRPPKPVIETLTPQQRVSADAWNTFCKSLPEPKTKERASAAWWQEYKGYVYSLLTLVVKDQKVLDYMTSEKTFPVWARAITHETYSPTVNYESLEIDGDAVSGFEFKKYLRRRFPDISAAGMSEFKARYMSKEFQAPLSQKMKLPNWCLIDASLPPALAFSANISEDLLEAFFGALNEIGDGFADGLGGVLCFNYIVHMFEGVFFDPKMLFGTPKTQVIQNGGRLGWGNNSVTVTTSDETASGYHSRVILNQAALAFFREHKVRIKEPVAIGQGPSKKAAENDAYYNMLVFMEKNGWDQERVMLERDKLMFKGFDQKLVDAVKAKAAKAGFTRVAFYRPRSTSTVSSGVIQLRGVGAAGKEQNLATVIDPDESAGRLKVLQKYVAQG